MIDLKMIEAEAAAHAKATWYHDAERSAAMHGFKAGAQWAIAAICKQYIERMKALREKKGGEG